MPQLPTFTANLAGNPINSGRAAGAEDFASIGDAGAGLRQAAKGFQQDMEESESRQALIGSTQVRAKYAKLMDEATLTGGNLEDIKAKMDDELAAIGTTFQTKRGVDSLDYYTANSTIMFDQKANEIKVTRATVGARLDASKFLNNAGALIQSNPGYLAAAEKDADDLAATWGGTTAEKRAEIADGLKKDLNMAAAMASARLEPKQTKDALQAGKWNLSPEQRQTAENFAQGRFNEARSDEIAARAQADYEKRQRNETARDTHFKEIIAGKAKQGSIMDDPNLDAATREHLIEFKEQRAKAMQAGDKRSDPVAVRNLFLAITAPDGDPRKVYNGNAIFDAVTRGSVNVSDASFLNNLVAGQKDENGRTLGTRLNSLMGTVGRAMSQDPQFTGQPALVASAQMDFQARVFERTEALRKANQDPNQVFNPASKEYVGSPEFVQPSITAARQQRAAISDVPTVTNQAEYDKLPNGASYKDAQGNVSTKKGKAASAPTEPDYGKREDGTPKGAGYFGEVSRPRGGFSTELSIGINFDGKERLIPLIVPTLTKKELTELVTKDADPKNVPQSILDKAVAHARKRIAAGKSPFADKGDQQAQPK